MHILILADPVDEQNAGVHVYTRELIRHLVKLDSSHQFSLIHKNENPFFDVLVSPKVQHYIIPGDNRPGGDTWRKFHKIPQLIHALGPDVIFEPCHILPPNLPKTARKVITIHDLTPITHPHLHTWQGWLGHRLFLKHSLKSADQIIAPSHTTRQALLTRYQNLPPITAIPLGLTPLPPSPGKTPQKPYLLYLGTIEPRKDLGTLIRAFTELKRTHEIPHQLILAGPPGWKHTPILKEARHPDITVTGEVSEEEKAELYRNADIFIHPSLYEGFGLPPLEAMSHGTPVITSTGGSLHELYKDHSLQFPPKDHEALKAHILTLLHTPALRAALTHKAKTYADTFTWHATAQKTLEVLTQYTSQEQ